MADGLVLGGIGLHLGAIERYMPQAHHPRFLEEAQDLDKQPLVGIKVAALEHTDAAVVRLQVESQHPEGQILEVGLLKLAGGRCRRSRRRAAASPSSWGQTASTHADPWSDKASGSGRDRAHPPGPAGNTPDGPLRASHSVMAAAGWSAQTARGV